MGIPLEDVLASEVRELERENERLRAALTEAVDEIKWLRRLYPLAHNQGSPSHA